MFGAMFGVMFGAMFGAIFAKARGPALKLDPLLRGLPLFLGTTGSFWPSPDGDLLEGLGATVLGEGTAACIVVLLGISKPGLIGDRVGGDGVFKTLVTNADLHEACGFAVKGGGGGGGTNSGRVLDRVEAVGAPSLRMP